MPKMTGGQFIAETFKQYGVTHVFFMPVITVRALKEMERLGIRRIMTRSEKAAAYMADGYARATKRAGICMSQSVGAFNLAAGLQDPYLASSPVIAITGRRPQYQQLRHAYQEVDHMAPFSAVTKYNNVVASLEQLPFSLRQAFRVATSGNPGPVHLDLEGFIGHGIAETEADFEVIAEESFISIPPFRPAPERERIQDVISAIRHAKRPVLVAGGGVTHSSAQQEVVAIAEKLSIPVATSLNGRGAIPEDHPLSVGVVGHYSRWSANQVVGEADLVIYVGSRTGSVVTNEWTVPAPGTRIVQVDIEPNELGRNYPTQIAVQADARAFLRDLIATATDTDRGSNKAWAVHVKEIVNAWHDENSTHFNSDAIPMRPERLCKEVTEHLPSDAVLVADTGHVGIWSGTVMEFRHPDQRYIRCAGSLGWGFPGAMGVKCALPDRPVICFVGDGGIWYHMTELDTAVRYGINTVTVINNNHSLNQEQSVNESVYGKQTAGSDALWIFKDTDFAKMAESFGAFGITVNRPGEFEGAMDQALASGKPAIIDVKTDISVIAAPAQPNAYGNDPRCL